MQRRERSVKPVRRSKDAFVVEFKVAKDIDDMAAKAEEALRQITADHVRAGSSDDGTAGRGRGVRLIGMRAEARKE